MDQRQAKAHFLEIYDTYADSIYRFCSAKTSSGEVAEDLTQEVFMRFWQSVREGEKAENERAFLYRIARNLIIDWYRKKKTQSLDALSEAGYDFAGTGYEDLKRTSEAREALAVVARLDEASREVIMMRFVEGLPPGDIAVVLGESANAVSVRINRAVKKLRELLHTHE